MKKILASAMLSLLVTVAANGQAAATRQPFSPAEQMIETARAQISKNPKQPDGYNTLAIALARRARETSDVSFYAQGEEAVQQSLQVAPENFGALKAKTWLLLGKHEFAQAREVATELNKKTPDDLQVYSFLTDANAELGNYEEAERACNWMLKLRPGNIPALTRAAYLRELFGNLDGAQELMARAFQATPASATEDRAWILTQIAHLQLEAGKTVGAEKLLNEALALFPDYHYALANLARTRIEQKRYEDAVWLFRKRYEAATHAENLYDLAEALELAGHHEEAARAFREFETKSLLEAGKWDNSNRELIFYYADYAHEPAKALEVASREYARRHDVYTRDAYAWALHVNGRDSEARQQMEVIAAVGLRDPKVQHRADMIRVAVSSSSTLPENASNGGR